VDIKSDDLPSKYSPLSTQIYSPPVHYFNKPHIQDVQVGDKYYYPPRNSICEVVKKYDSSDKKYKQKYNLYDVKLTDGTIVTIREHDSYISVLGEYEYLLILPNAEMKTKYDKFNKAMNESTLQPYVSYADKTYNVYWQEISNVARYIVSVYKIIKFSNKPNIYHLQDIEVNKNKKMVIVRDLVGENFVFVVEALDSDNNTLALSRGILNSGEPRCWNVLGSR